MCRRKKNILILVAAFVWHLTAGARAGDVVAVVSATNLVDTVNPIELTNIFLGKSRHFPDGTPANPVDLPEGSAARKTFYAEYAGRSPAQIKAYWSKMIFTGRGGPPRALQNGEAVRQWVASNPQAIGYLDRSLVDDSIKVLQVRE